MTMRLKMTMKNLATISRVKMKVIQVKIICETVDSIMRYAKLVQLIVQAYPIRCQSNISFLYFDYKPGIIEVMKLHRKLIYMIILYSVYVTVLLSVYVCDVLFYARQLCITFCCSTLWRISL